MSMKGRLFLYAVLALSVGGPVRADDVLDAKLNALKKKTQKRAYSTPAILNDQNLVVPQAVTEEEKSLDKKIREMEQESVATPGMMARQTASTRSVPRPSPESSANWLTPELLKEISGNTENQEQEGDSWIVDELNRQKALRLEKQSLEEEKKLVNQRLNGGLQQKSSTASAPLNTYDQSLQKIISGGAATPSYLDRNRSVYKRPEETAGASEPTVQRKPSVFSTANRRESNFPAVRSSSDSRQSGFKTNSDRAPSTAPSSQPPSWETPEETFREKVRRTAPGYEANPFEENPMPGMVNSIWE